MRVDYAVPFDAQPTLRGDLVTLRPLAAEHVDTLYAAASDPLIWQQHPACDRHRAGPFRRFFEDALASGGALVVSDNCDGSVIGSSRFHGYDEARSEVEIGWTFLARAYWGGRYNGEMKRLMMRHAFVYVDTVVLLAGPDNLRSQRAIEKLGGVRSGLRPDASGLESIEYRVTQGALRGG